MTHENLKAAFLQGGERESAEMLDAVLRASVREAFWKVMADEVTALCGPRYRPDLQSSNHRAGSETGTVYLGGEKEEIRRPRVRHESGGEVRLESYQAASREGLKARHKKAFRPKTTVQDPDRTPAPNRLAAMESPSRSGEVFVSDITYVATREGWLYLAVTMDLYSRRIAGWHLDDSMKTDLIIQAARKAVTATEVRSDAIFHSDRGCQSTSREMRSWLSRRGFLSSMSSVGYCYDNASCESLFASLKREAFPAGCVFDSKREARRTIFQYIETFYNRERIHTALGNQSPEKFLTNHFPPETITLN